MPFVRGGGGSVLHSITVTTEFPSRILTALELTVKKPF